MEHLFDRLVGKARNYLQRGKLLEAMVLGRKMIQLRPDNAEAHYMMGLIAYHQENEMALKFLLKSIKLGNQRAECHFMIGHIYRKTVHINQAFHHFQQACQLQPGFVEAYLNMGLILQEQKNYTEAISVYQQALKHQPHSIEVLVNLGICYEALQDFKGKQEFFERALAIQPTSSMDYNSLAFVYINRCQSRVAIDYCQQALKLNPSEQIAHSNLLFYLCATPGITQQDILKWSRQWGEKFSDPFRSKSIDFEYLKQKQGPLRVGIISSEFRACAAAFFRMPLFSHYHPEVVELVVYSGVKKPDAVTAYIQSQVTLWRDISALSDSEVVSTIRQDNIQILLDPGIGHASGNFLHYFSFKPAPVQITDYPTTTGMKAMDYRITDAYFDPLGDENMNVETLAYLPNIFCYQPPENTPEVSSLPYLKKGYYTLGSFNNILKLNPVLIKLWSQLLKELPESTCLMLKHTGFADSANQKLVQKLFEEEGISGSRVQFGKGTGTFEEHLANYSEIDLALDTFPFNGMTTTCEALWMGVPVVSLVGNTHFSRAGLSILSTLGLEEYLAYSQAEYIALVKHLLAQSEGLQHFRQSIRSKMKQSKLCDYQAYVREWENMFQNLWRNWCLSNT